MERDALIAEFMGWETLPNGFKVPNLYPSYNMHDIENTGWMETEPSEMMFNERWDWLMPVIEKIGLIELPNDTYENGERKYVEQIFPRTFGMRNEESELFMFRFNGFRLHQSASLIECAYNAVVEVIKHQSRNL